jgi:prolyl oligopeptidase
MRSWREPWAIDVIGPEYGDPREPNEAPWVFAYSPYHNLREGVRYPSVLTFAGASDIRCRPWHSRKFAARLQHVSGSERPALLRVHPNVGHNTGLSRRGEAAYTAEWVGFLMREIGLQPM